MWYANDSSLLALGDRVPEQSRICQECPGKLLQSHLFVFFYQLLLNMCPVCLNKNTHQPLKRKALLSLLLLSPSLSFTPWGGVTSHWQQPLSHMDCCPQSVQGHTVKMGTGREVQRCTVRTERWRKNRRHHKTLRAFQKMKSHSLEIKT